MKDTLFVFLIGVLLPFELQAKDSRDTNEAVIGGIPKLSSVILTDGISRDEANVISEYFFHYHQDIGCGATEKIIDSGDIWRVTTLEGFAAQPGEDIKIHKKTGAIRWGKDIVIDNPMDMLKAKR